MKIEKLNLDVTDEQIENAIQQLKKFDKIIEKHFKNGISMETRGILMIAFLGNKGTDEDFEKQVISLKNIMNNKKIESEND